MNWRQHAACRGLDINAAYTVQWKRQRAYIAAHCDHCPVRQECLGDAPRSSTR